MPECNGGLLVAERIGTRAAGPAAISDEGPIDSLRRADTGTLPWSGRGENSCCPAAIWGSRFENGPDPGGECVLLMCFSFCCISVRMARSGNFIKKLQSCTAQQRLDPKEKCLSAASSALRQASSGLSWKSLPAMTAFLTGRRTRAQACPWRAPVSRTHLSPVAWRQPSKRLS